MSVINCRVMKSPNPNTLCVHSLKKIHFN